MQQHSNPWQFSRKTRTGALILMSILLIMIAVWRLLPTLMPPRPDPEGEKLTRAWTTFQQQHITAVSDDTGKTEYAYSKRNRYDQEEAAPSSRTEAHPVPFNPNTATEQELIAIGFPARTAATMIKYRSKGGVFRKKEDLQKLYTLSAEDYERIAPYVRIATTSPPDVPLENKVVAAASRASPRILELNGADADALLSLRGIGPAFSKRIIHFRDALGGFISVEQLQEVYGFPDSTYQQLRYKLSADISRIQKLNINQCSEEALAKHPYIGRKLAANIIKFRKEHNNYSEIEQLKQVPLINDEKYRKIAPYLSTH